MPLTNEQRRSLMTRCDECGRSWCPCCRLVWWLSYMRWLLWYRLWFRWRRVLRRVRREPDPQPASIIGTGNVDVSEILRSFHERVQSQVSALAALPPHKDTNE
jgi:hypothetical protein